MQIITGKYKNKVLKVVNPEEQAKTVVRHAIFNIIGSKIVGAAVIDLFSDTGYYAIESLSRGAKSVVVNTGDFSKNKIIKQNIDKICVEDKIKLDDSRGRFIKVNSFNQIDVIFCRVVEGNIGYTTDIVRYLKESKGSLKEILFILETNDQEIQLVTDEFGDEGMRRFGKTFIKIWKI